MDVTTALCILVPAEYAKKINEIRQQHDKAYNRWFAHCNIVFPFVPQDQLDETISRLGPVLSQVPSFDVVCDKINHFAQRGVVSTVHFDLEPIVKLQELDLVIQTNLLNMKDISKSQYSTFHPHVTLGQCPTAQVESFKESLHQQLSTNEKITWTVDKVVVLTRSLIDKSVPFSVYAKIPLKPKTNSDVQFDLF